MPISQSGGAGNIASAQIVDGTIVNADINAAAAIDFSKVAGSATGATSATRFVDTQVLNASGAYSAWADLNISAVVGVYERMVLLRVYSDYAGDAKIAARTKGDATEQTSTSAGAGLGASSVSCRYTYEYIVCKTDASGVIQMKTSAGNLTVNVLAFW